MGPTNRATETSRFDTRSVASAGHPFGYRMDDEEIGLIRVKQELKGIPTYGVGLGGVDWERLAQSFGADGAVRVRAFSFRAMSACR